MISVIMSVYNETKRELELSINSILNQSYKNFEFIIVLDNPDNIELKDILLKNSNKDSRIKVIINETNIGLANSLNKAFNYSKGEYIARMDADDISNKDRLKEQYNYFKKNEDCDILATDKNNIDEYGKIIPSESYVVNDSYYFCKIMKCCNIIIHPSIMMKREVMVNLSGYRNFKASQDYDMWLRAIRYGFNFHILDKKLINYRIRQNSIGNLDYSKQHGYMMYAKYLDKKGLTDNNFDNDDYCNYLKMNKLYSLNDKKIYNSYYKILKNQYPSFSILKKVFFIFFIFMKKRILFKYYMASRKKDKIFELYYKKTFS